MKKQKSKKIKSPREQLRSIAMHRRYSTSGPATTWIPSKPTTSTSNEELTPVKRQQYHSTILNSTVGSKEKKKKREDRLSMLKEVLQDSFCYLQIILRQEDRSILQKKYSDTLNHIYAQRANHFLLAQSNGFNQENENAAWSLMRKRRYRIVDYEHCISLYTSLKIYTPTDDKKYKNIDALTTTLPFHKKNILQIELGTFDEELEAAICTIVSSIEELAEIISMYEHGEISFYKVVHNIYKNIPKTEMNNIRLDLSKIIDEFDAWRIVYNYLAPEMPKLFSLTIKMHLANMSKVYDIEKAVLKKQFEEDVRKLKSEVTTLFLNNQDKQDQIRDEFLQDILYRHFDALTLYDSTFREKIQLIDKFFLIHRDVKTKFNSLTIITFHILFILDRKKLYLELIDFIPSLDNNRIRQMYPNKEKLEATADVFISQLVTLTRNKLVKNNIFTPMLATVDQYCPDYDMTISSLLEFDLLHYNYCLKLMKLKPLLATEKIFENTDDIYNKEAALTLRQIHNRKALEEPLTNLWLLNAIIAPAATDYLPPNLYLLHNDNANLPQYIIAETAYLEKKFSDCYRNFEKTIKNHFKQQTDNTKLIDSAYSYFNKHRPSNLRQENQKIISEEIVPFICQYNDLFSNESSKTLISNRKAIPTELVWFLDYLNFINPGKCQSALMVDENLPEQEIFANILSISCNYSPINAPPALVLTASSNNPTIVPFNDYILKKLEAFRTEIGKNEPVSILKNIMGLVEKWHAFDDKDNLFEKTGKNKNELTKEIKQCLEKFSTRYSEIYPEKEHPHHDPEKLKATLKHIVKEQLRCKVTETDKTLLEAVCKFIDYIHNDNTEKLQPPLSPIGHHLRFN